MSDILRPELQWIEGRCYRVNDPVTEVTPFQEHDLYAEESVFEPGADEDDEDVEVTMLDNSRYSTSLHVSKHYIGYIIGKKGAIKSRIERDTRTEINIPKQGQTGDIVILGQSASNVKAARRRISIIVLSSRQKQKPTHFLSLPTNSSEIMENFIKFKESVLRDCPDRGLEESIFIHPGKLHVTLGVMCLMDSEERLQASQLLQEARQTIILPMLREHRPLRVRVKGVSYMNDDPREMHVLFGLVREENAPSGVLQKLADDLCDFFRRAGLLKVDHERTNVKLHVTLINSKYRDDISSNDGGGGGGGGGGSGSGPYRRPRQSFDGSRVLEQFADYDFGVAELNDVHLSAMHTTADDGYYQSTCVVSCH